MSTREKIGYKKPLKKKKKKVIGKRIFVKSESRCFTEGLLLNAYQIGDLGT